MLFGASPGKASRGLYRRQETVLGRFYLDPPYFGTEDFYGADAFTRSDFARLAEQLAAIAGGFILTVNDAPETRRFSRRSVKNRSASPIRRPKARRKRRLS
jgi:site-specific DNA-adenine methylase